MYALVGIGLIGALVFGVPRSVFIDRDCADFATQSEAQAFFRSEGAGDPHRLDADGDGRACELNGR